MDKVKTAGEASDAAKHLTASIPLNDYAQLDKIRTAYFHVEADVKIIV